MMATKLRPKARTAFCFISSATPPSKVLTWSKAGEAAIVFSMLASAFCTSASGIAGAAFSSISLNRFTWNWPAFIPCPAVPTNSTRFDACSTFVPSKLVEFAHEIVVGRRRVDFGAELHRRPGVRRQTARHPRRRRPPASLSSGRRRDRRWISGDARRRSSSRGAVPSRRGLRRPLRGLCARSCSLVRTRNCLPSSPVWGSPGIVSRSSEMPPSLLSSFWRTSLDVLRLGELERHHRAAAQDRRRSCRRRG